jgi:hypothetical protein
MEEFMTQPTAPQQIAELIHGYWKSQAVYVAAKLGIADLLAERPRTAEQLADVTPAHAPSLYRVLRALAGIGIFAEGEDGRFSMTPLAEPLRRGVPGSKWAMAVMMGEEHFHVWGDLIFTVETGQTAFDRIYGMPIFEFLTENEEKGRIFDEAMSGIHGQETGGILEAYDFSGIDVLADIGGGNGTKLITVLQKHPAMKGILFDLPPVVERASRRVEEAGVADRCELVGGNFFEQVPGGADAYVMRHIIHDWDDEKSLAILRNCHAAMPDDGKLLVVESVIPPGNEPFMGKWLDLAMMLIPGGKERTEAEYRTLYQQAGFELQRIIPTSLEVSVIEGRKQK